VKFWKFFSTYKLLKNFLKLFKVFTFFLAKKKKKKVVGANNKSSFT